MNKYSSFLSLLPVAMCGVLTSCEQDVFVDQNPSVADAAAAQKIEFYLDVETRGEDVTLQNLDTIYVFGTYLKDDVRYSCFSTDDYDYGFVPFIRSVKKAPGEYDGSVAEDHYYRPETDIYWDESWSQECQFFAMNVKPEQPLYGEFKGSKYYDYELADDVEKAYAKMKIYDEDNTFGVINFFQPNLVKDQIDVVYANNTSATKSGSRYGIPLNFKHLYTAFDIKFVQSGISDYKVKIYAADIVQRVTNSYWFNLDEGEDGMGAFFSGGFGGDSESANIVTCPDQAYLEVTEVAQRLNDNKPYAYLFPTDVNSPKTDGNLLKFTKGSYGVDCADPSIYLKLYLTVEDKNGHQIYPTATDLQNNWRNKNNVGSEVVERTNYGFWDTVGVANISLGKNFEAKAGNLYSITVDLSYGVGYFNPNDPDGSVPGEDDGDGSDRGGKPVLDGRNLNRPLGANVWVHDFVVEGLDAVVIPNNHGSDD